MRVKKMVVLAFFATVALAVFSVESMLPPLAPIPGIKLGLANVVTLILLEFYRPGEVFCVLLVRIFLASMFGGQMMFFAYSLSGGVCCFVVMLLLHRLLPKEHMVMISMGGAVAHNAAQILTARLLIGSASVYMYIPMLLLSGMITGAFTGCAAGCVCRYLKKVKI